MRIGLVTWSWDRHQGISRCVVELARRLAPRHAVDVYAATVDAPPIPGVRVHEVRPRVGWFFLAEWEFFLRAGRLARAARHDLLHLHFPVRAPAAVVTCHGVAAAALHAMRALPRHVGVDMPLARMLPYYLQLPLYRHQLRDERNLVLAVAGKARREVMEHYGRAAEHIRIVPNGVDFAQFHAENRDERRARLRARLRLAGAQRVFLFVGNHFRHKGLRYAAETVARLPEHAVLVVVGAGDPRAVPDPHGALARLQRERRVVFAGVDPDIADYYAMADALLFPSIYESFGLVVLEALASGLPVITAATVALAAEALVDGDNGFVVDVPWDVAGLAQRARVIVEDPGLTAKIAARGRELSHEYSWERHVALTERAYASVRGSAGPAARAVEGAA